MRTATRTILPALVAAASLAASCQSDGYETGDGRYSYLRADLVEAHTSTAGTITTATTDDGESLTLATPLAARWAATPDSVYRAILYYSRTGTSATSSSSAITVEAHTAAAVAVCRPRAASAYKTIVTDPVAFQSMWTGADGRYVNLALDLKTGTADTQDARHTVGIVLDSTVTRPDGRTVACLRLYHDQGGVPEYYSTRTYLSIPTAGIKADSAALTLVTYKGTVTRTVATAARKKV